MSPDMSPSPGRPRPPRRVPEAAPRQTIRQPTEIGNLVAELRRSLRIRQADLADRAGVGRHWITELERGKPSCEIALVLRTLFTLGLEVTVTPTDPIPGWLTRARLDALAAAQETQRRRNRRRRGRREQTRLQAVARNAPTAWPELE